MQIALLAKEAVHSEYVLAFCVEFGVGFHYGTCLLF